MRKEKMAALCRHKCVQILKFRLYFHIHHSDRGGGSLSQRPEPSVKSGYMKRMTEIKRPLKENLCIVVVKDENITRKIITFIYLAVQV